ncbi:MAG: thioredoxin [Chloroflexi bacterium]|nr:thioredoxin [Chloroflexota bacterium]
MLWISSNGESPPTDVRKALDAAANDYSALEVLIIDTAAEPAFKERFSVGKHAVLIGWYNNEVISRRQRPWATDVQGTAEKLAGLIPEPEQDPNGKDKTEENKELPVDNVPVHVTDADFEKEVINHELPVLVDFWADWCGPCKMVAPTLEKLAGEYAGKVRIAKVDVDANPGLAQAFRIMSIPTLMFFKEGKIVGQTAGALPEPTLRDALEQLVALEIPAE